MNGLVLPRLALVTIHSNKAARLRLIRWDFFSSGNYAAAMIADLGVLSIAINLHDDPDLYSKSAQMP